MAGDGTRWCVSFRRRLKSGGYAGPLSVKCFSNQDAAHRFYIQKRAAGAEASMLVHRKGATIYHSGPQR